MSSREPDEDRAPGSGSPSLQASAAKANEQTRRRSPFMFLVIGLCFFLPFISLSCSGRTLATMSGVQLVTGAEVEIDEEALTEGLEEFLPEGTDGADSATEPQQSTENDPSIWAIIALAGSALGVVVGFVLKARPRSVASLAAALLGLAGLIGLRFDLQGDLSETGGAVTIDYRVGYWIAAILFAVLVIAHGSYLRVPRPTGPPSTGPPGPGT